MKASQKRKLLSDPTFFYPLRWTQNEGLLSLLLATKNEGPQRVVDI